MRSKILPFLITLLFASQCLPLYAADDYDLQLEKSRGYELKDTSKSKDKKDKKEGKDKEKNKKDKDKDKDKDKCPNFGFYAQGDGIFFGGDTRDRAVRTGKRNLQDQFNVPRVRLYVKGKNRHIYYSLEYDAAEHRFRETLLRDEKFKHFWFTVGQFKVPYSLWFLESSRYFNFLEQSLPTNAFNPGYRLGVMAQFFCDPFTLSVSEIGPDSNNNILGNQLSGHVPLATNVRLTFAPIHMEKYVLHFAAADIQQQTDSTNRFRFRTSPEVRTEQDYSLVDTNFIQNCRNFNGQEYEAVFILKSLTVSGQYYNTHVNRFKNNRDLDFDGCSFVADYFLTGEHYEYDFHDGKIEKISKIRHCYGAWQLLARYSNIDLTDENIHGGREDNVTLGVGVWFKHFHLLANYIWVDTHPSENGFDRRVNILGLRLQVMS